MKDILPPRELEARRIRAIGALEEGRSRSEVATMLGITHTSLSNWVARYRSGGIEDLLARSRGRPAVGRLSPQEAAQVRRILATKLPEEVGLSGSLWSWRLVQALLFKQFEIELSRWTIARYLRDWGFHPPLEASGRSTAPWRHAGGQTDSKFYLVMRGQAKGDQTPWVGSIMWAVGNRGEAAFMAYGEPPPADAMVEFLDRLLLHSGTRVLAIIGDEDLFQPEQVRVWLERNAGRIRLQRHAGVSVGFKSKESSKKSRNRGD